jgi:hypothetical protein
MTSFSSVPVNVTRNCKSTNNGAKFVTDAIDIMGAYFEPPFNLIEKFSSTLQDVRASIAVALTTLTDIFDKIVSTASIFSKLDFFLKPFNDALNTKISVSIPGPFCSKQVDTRVKYPCGVKICRRCGWFCVSYPCGVRICEANISLTLPT